MMKSAEAWKILFQRAHIKEHYYEKIASKASVGLDKITVDNFESDIDNNVEIIYRKAHNKTYNFTRYKQLLFLKGAKKPPRSVSVPTVRDKLTLSVLNELIVSVYGDDCKTRLPQLIINEIFSEVDHYEMFIKLDIKSFYASINQDKLVRKVKHRIRKPEILHLIESAIQTESLLIPIKEIKKKEARTLGIPEGLPISNALANIYLFDLDEKYRSNTNIKYWRFVDDILILLNKKDFSKIKKDIADDIEKLKLSFNDKADEGKITDGFEYLGYRISSDLISVRKSSILKIEQSIQELFGAVKDDNLKYIEWKLNNKITGFILDTNKYGWLFFYSQITDLNLLFHLDDLVQKFVVRYKLTGKIKCKKFVRAYHEMRQALHETKYIPNFDDYSIEQKREILVAVYGEEAYSWNEKIVIQRFNLIMSREIRDIERDIENFS